MRKVLQAIYVGILADHQAEASFADSCAGWPNLASGTDYHEDGPRSPGLLLACPMLSPRFEVALEPLEGRNPLPSSWLTPMIPP